MRRGTKGTLAAYSTMMEKQLEARAAQFDDKTVAQVSKWLTEVMEQSSWMNRYTDTQVKRLEFFQKILIKRLEVFVE